MTVSLIMDHRFSLYSRLFIPSSIYAIHRNHEHRSFPFLILCTPAWHVASKSLRELNLSVEGHNLSGRIRIDSKNQMVNNVRRNNTSIFQGVSDIYFKKEGFSLLTWFVSDLVTISTTHIQLFILLKRTRKRADWINSGVSTLTDDVRPRLQKKSSTFIDCH